MAVIGSSHYRNAERATSSRAVYAAARPPPVAFPVFPQRPAQDRMPAMAINPRLIPTVRQAQNNFATTEERDQNDNGEKDFFANAQARHIVT
jgi:hypothetical protein